MSTIIDDPVVAYVGFDHRGVIVGRAFRSSGPYDRRPRSWEAKSARSDGWWACNVSEERAKAILRLYGATTISPEPMAKP